MRGRKPLLIASIVENLISTIKKESPNEGTETAIDVDSDITAIINIKKESPNEGTETLIVGRFKPAISLPMIKKESPNEGTETV